MTDSPSPAPDLTGTIFDFTPVPLARRRYDGWSADTQVRFISALSVMGSVGAACRAVEMGPDMRLIKAALRDEPSPPKPQSSPL